MPRSLRFGLAVALAVCALGATGAHAANFTASGYIASISGAQTTEHVFTVQGSKVTCKIASFSGSLAFESSEFRVFAPSYLGCTAFGFVNAEVNTGSCEYVFTASTSTSGGMRISGCGAFTPLVITAGPCKIEIPDQTPTTNAVDYKNESGGVLFTSTVSGIHSKVTSGFLCPLASKETDTSGTYTGSSKMKEVFGKTFDVG